MPDSPVRLSIVVPCYDMGDFLAEAIASVERALPPATEIVIVDDGSREPRTLEILAALERAGQRVVRQENRGLSAARNRGIEEARGEYILPLDADNRLLPGFADAAIGILDADPRIGVVYGDRIEFGLRNSRVTVPAFDLDRLLWVNYIDACAVFRRQVWQQVGGYDVALRSWEDWEFWIGVAARGWRFHRVELPTFEYRVRAGSMLTVASGDSTMLRSHLAHIYAKHGALFAERLAGVLTVGQIDYWQVQAAAAAMRDRCAQLQAELDGRCLASTAPAPEINPRLPIDDSSRKPARIPGSRLWQIRERAVRVYRRAIHWRSPRAARPPASR